MSTPNRLGPIVAGVAVAISGLIAAFALVYVNAVGVDEATHDAETQQAAEAALGVSASTRFALGQSLLFLDAGGVDAQALAILEVDARDGLEELGNRVRTLVGFVDTEQAAVFERAMADLSLAAESFLDAIGETDSERAGTLAATGLGAALDGLDRYLIDVRNDAAVSLAQVRAETSRLGTAARFMVAFGIPAIALVVVAVVARRRARRITLTAQLEKERELNRSKDQLIANLSHELRTPLTGIYSAALAIEESGLTDRALAEELTEIIVDQSADLTRMVEDLLVSAQAEAGRLSVQLEEVEISSEVEKVLRELRGRESILVRVRSGTVRADPTRLRQVLRNLLSNAERHGGDQIAVMGRRNGPWYELAVVDDGPGVPSEIESRLFTPFVHEADRPLVTGSVGLGLSITRVLAEQMGGSVAYHRREGRTWFLVSLGLAGAPPGIKQKQRTAT